MMKESLCWPLMSVGSASIADLAGPIFVGVVFAERLEGWAGSNAGRGTGADLIARLGFCAGSDFAAGGGSTIVGAASFITILILTGGADLVVGLIAAILFGR